ncbi:MAG: DUF1385 domain-containing protein [Lachnospiraceae bacterium]|nr:DUF1385 domain-containing protein [Lachnospiraceae bacterium]
MKNSGIGGQAVIEGVMMKNGGKYAVAVRKPDGDIAVEVKTCKDESQRKDFLKLPIIRGVVSFIDSLTIGMGALTLASNYYVEGEEQSAFEQKLDKITKGRAEKIINGVTVFISVCFALVIFVLLPVLLSGLLAGVVKDQVLLAFFEGLIRVAIFVLYIVLISQVQDIKRLFMYHGAEHKAISCIENGKKLNVENARTSSREHKRCGTGFILNVMVISIIFFMVIRVDNMALKLLLRLLLIPVIAGISYEFLRFAGNHDSKIVNILSKPGMLMQKLTTREPDDDMLEVAIASIEAVFDWEAFVARYHGKAPRKNKDNSKKNEKRSEYTVKGSGAASVAADVAAASVSAPDAEKTEGTVAAAETEKAVPADNKPLEIDISQFFDIKLPSAESDNSKKNKKKDRADSENTPAPAAADTGSYEDDAILAALDFMFEYNGKKTEIEISDDPEVCVTGPEEENKSDN